MGVVNPNIQNFHCYSDQNERAVLSLIKVMQIKHTIAFCNIVFLYKQKQLAEMASCFVFKITPLSHYLKKEKPKLVTYN